MRSDGGWDEPQYTGTGFPSDYYINYHLYRLVFPVMALGRCLRTGAQALVAENLADDAVPASHNPTIRSALATSDKEYVGIEGATHYYQNQPAQLHQCISAVLDWSRRKGLLAG